MFVKNAWYAAALSHEVAPALLRRTVAGEDIVFFRDTTGNVRALEDRCSHRQVPLSKGRLLGNEIECWYHGLRFDGTGTCTRVPSQNSVPRGACVRAFPVVEQDGFVWLWTGEPKRADLARIPRHESCSDPQFVGSMSYCFVECNYRFGIDNILDFSHAGFVHESTIASRDLVETPPEVTIGPEEVWVTRTIHNEANSPLFTKIMNMDRIDRTQEIVFWPIGNTRVTTTARPPGSPQAKPLRLVTTTIFTPATEDQSHVFVGLYRDFALDNQALTAGIQEQVMVFIQEDVDVATHQQANWRDDRTMTNLMVDKAPLGARRILERLAVADDAPTKISPESPEALAAHPAQEVVGSA